MGSSMAGQTVMAEEVLLDVRVAEASPLHRFYLLQENKILGALAGKLLNARNAPMAA